MPVVQRHAIATVDSATDKATVLVGESRGFAMRAGSARKRSATVVKVSRGLLGVRGGRWSLITRTKLPVAWRIAA
jgi:hypothetical protein